jgi:hypothetical protein
MLKYCFTAPQNREADIEAQRRKRLKEKKARKAAEKERQAAEEEAKTFVKVKLRGEWGLVISSLYMHVYVRVSMVVYLKGSQISTYSYSPSHPRFVM